MIRKAGDLINEYLREGRLAANRAEPIGSGTYGVVYPSDIPGNVIKQKHVNGLAPFEDFVREANLQDVGSSLGISPRVVAVETFPGGIGDRIEMADVRTNFESHGKTQWPTGRDAVRVNQQLGELALKGVDLDDRHNGNVMYNKMTGRPTQLDYGRARQVTGEDQVAALTNATEAGFVAAGLDDIGQIFSATVYDLLAGGEVDAAMDVAKQGFSRLQKL
jgi:hypothetical protein